MAEEVRQRQLVHNLSTRERMPLRQTANPREEAELRKALSRGQRRRARRAALGFLEGGSAAQLLGAGGSSAAAAAATRHPLGEERRPRLLMLQGALEALRGSTRLEAELLARLAMLNTLGQQAEEEAVGDDSDAAGRKAGLRRAGFLLHLSSLLELHQRRQDEALVSCACALLLVPPGEDQPKEEEAEDEGAATESSSRGRSTFALLETLLRHRLPRPPGGPQEGGWAGGPGALPSAPVSLEAGEASSAPRASGSCPSGSGFRAPTCRTREALGATVTAPWGLFPRAGRHSSICPRGPKMEFPGSTTREVIRGPFHGKEFVLGKSGGGLYTKRVCRF